MGSKQSVLKSNSGKKSGKLKSKSFKRYLRSSFLKALKVAPIKLIDVKKAPSENHEASEEPRRKSSTISTTNNFESKKHELNRLENILRIEPKRADDKIEFLTSDDFGLFSPAFSSKKSSFENFDSYSSEEYSESQDSEESIDDSIQSYDDFKYYGNQSYYYDPKENLNVAYVQGTVYRREIYGPPKEDRTDEVPIGREEYVITRRFEFGDKTKPTMPKKTTFPQTSVSPGSSKETRSVSTRSSSRGTSSSSVSTISSKKSAKKKASGKRSVKGKPKKTAKPGPSRQKGSKKKALTVKKGKGKIKKPTSKKKPVKKNKSDLSLRSVKSKTPNQESPKQEIETPYFCQPPFFPYFPDQRPCVCPQHGPYAYESQVGREPYAYESGRVKMGASGKDVRIGVGQGTRPGYDIEFNDSGNMNLKIEQLAPGNNKTFIYRSGNAGSATSLKEPSESSKKLKKSKSKSKVSIKEGIEEKPKSALKLQKSQTSVKSKKKKIKKKKSKTKLGGKVGVKKTPSKIEKVKSKKPESIKAAKKSAPKTGKTPWEKKARHLKKPIVERCEFDETELRNAILKPENKDLLKKLCQGFEDKVDKEKTDSKQSDLKQLELKHDSNTIVKADSKTVIPNMNIVINVPPCGKVENIAIPFEKRDTIDSVRSGGSKEIYFDVGLKNMGAEYMQNVAQKSSMSYNHPDAKIKGATPSIGNFRRTIMTGNRNSEAIQTDIAMIDLKDTPDHILKNSVEETKHSLEETGIKSAIKSPVGSAGNTSINSDGKKTDAEDDLKKRKVKLTDQEHDLKNTSRVNFDEDLKEESKQLLDIKENLAFLRKELEEGFKEKKGKGTNRVIAIYTRRKPSGQDIFEECLSACEDGTIELGKRERSKSRKRRKTSFDECQDKKLPSFKSDIPKARFETKNEEFDSDEEISSDDYYEKLKEQLRSELEASQTDITKKDPASTSKRLQIQEDDSPEEKRRKHREMLEEEMKKGGFYHPSNKKVSSASDIRDDMKFDTISRTKSERTSNIKPTDVTQLFLKSLEELQEAWHHPDNVTGSYNLGNAEDENQIVRTRDPSMASRNQKRRMYQRKLASRTSIWQHPESSIVEESPLNSVDSEEQLILKETGRNRKTTRTSDVGPNNPQSRGNSTFTRQGSNDSPRQKIQIQRSPRTTLGPNDNTDDLGQKTPRERGSSGGQSSPKGLRSPRGTQRKIGDRLSNDTTIGKRNPDGINFSEDFEQKTPRERGSSGGHSSPKGLRSPRGTQRKIGDRLSNDTTIGKRNPDGINISDDFEQKTPRERGSSGGQSTPKELRSPRGTERKILSNETTIGKRTPNDKSSPAGSSSLTDRHSLRSLKTPSKDGPNEQYEITRGHSTEKSGQEIISEHKPTVLPIQTTLVEGQPSYEPSYEEAKITVPNQYNEGFSQGNRGATSERLSALKNTMPESILQKRQTATDSKHGSYQRHTKFANGQDSNGRKSTLNDMIRATGKVHLKELNEGTLKVDVTKLKDSKGFEGQVPDDGNHKRSSAFDIKTMEADMEECQKAYNITDDELKMMKDEHKMPDSQGAQCLAFCMTEKLGVVNQNGEMDKTAMAAFSKEVLDEKEHPKIDTVVNGCDEDVKENYKHDDDFSKCTNTLKVVGCIIKESEKVGLQHPFAGKN